MLVVSVLMAVSSLASLIMMILVVTNSFSLAIAGRYALFLNAAVAFSEVTWAVLMMIMLGSLFFGRFLSERFVHGRTQHEAPLLSEDNDRILGVPSMYDV